MQRAVSKFADIRRVNLFAECTATQDLLRLCFALSEITLRATDATDGNKVFPGKTRTSANRARTSAHDVTDRVGQGLSAAQKRVEKGLRSLSGRHNADAPAGTKRAAGNED
ncbi:hypothetical protein [Mycolicibacterium sp. HK-90]|uniref:hypothetical protein n=1 Tax=Mycolicibacterium sp. HK-90 TaxID=3056937 RepID=UPI00265AC5F1|nr:hypothetical protein [Mycolicibacterium sp. HK-90]WKG02483.1 hypothetical protein QU592_25230 [Mycolicibacterium sp. HK-90]